MRPESRIVRGAHVATLAIAVALSMVAMSCSKTPESSGSSTPGTETGSGSADTTPDILQPVSGEPKSGGQLRVAVEAETDGWNPTVNRWAASGTQVALAFFDPLVAFDKDLQPKPYLAESLTPNADYTQWVIKLRSGVKFHDGSPLNSDAVVKSVNAFKASTLTGAAAKPIIGVEKVDDLSTKLTMEQPWAAFPNSLTAQAGVVPAPKMLDDPNGSANPVGTGPFKFKSWQRDNVLVVEKNPDYWRKGLPYFDSIEFRPIPEAQARINSLEGGNADIVTSSTEESVNKLLEGAKAGRYQLIRSTGNSDLNMVLLNTSKAPMDDVRVRQAMAYALDRETLAQVTNSDPSLTADSVFQPDSKWYTKQSDYPNFDLAKAKSLVDAYTKEKGPITFTLGSATDPDILRGAQTIAEQWKAAGMQVDIKTFQQADFILNAVTGTYQAQVWRQFGAADPDNNYVWWTSENTKGPLALNFARNEDPQIDAALKTGRGSNDFAVRKKAYADLSARQTADLPYLWLNHLRWTAAANLNLRGLTDQPLPDGSKSAALVNGVMPLTGVWRAS